ncbi:MAG: hypothetical protein PWP48_438 [Clostridiales bacterium]|jgi:uncharacterized membrane protein YdjX (TVP38/TMEM64 family)|nr:hypothetical protein [Clostridiales bacterium]MDK2991205.1 hypothetical protein [Clostridiales bacterium]
MMERLLKKENIGIIILVGLILSGVYLANKYHVSQYIDPNKLGGTLQTFGVWGPLVFMALCALRPLSLLSAGLFSFAGGFIFGFVYGTIYTYIGIVTGTFIAFGLARYFGSGFINKLLERALKGKAADVFAQVREEKAFSTVFLLRVVPILPVDAVSYGSGLTNIKFKDYALATMLSMIHGTAAYVYMGSMARNITVDSVAISILLYVIITVVPIVLAIRFNKIPILNILLKDAFNKLKNRT